MGSKQKIRRVLLVGGNGFIGSHLTDELIKQGYQVRVLDVREDLFRDRLDKVEYVLGSFSEPGVVEGALEGCEVLIHLAHSTVPALSLIDPEQEVLDSVSAFVTMINRFRGKESIKIVYFSSGGAVYGNPKALPVPETAHLDPVSPYGVAKVMMEKYLKMFSYLYGHEYIIVRPSNPYGPRQNYNGMQGAIPIFLKRMLENETISIWGDGKSIKDYIYIEDLSRAVVGLINKGFDNNIYNISSGQGKTLNEVIHILETESGSRAKLNYEEEHRYDARDIVLSSSRLNDRTGWTPEISIEEGVTKTLGWIRGIERIGRGQ